MTYQDHTEVKVMLALYLPVLEIRRGYYGNLVVKLLDMLITIGICVCIFYNQKRFRDLAIMIYTG